jgi:hypothetical protein
LPQAVFGSKADTLGPEQSRKESATLSLQFSF